MIFSGFDWDRGNRSKCLKHGASIAEIESLFHGTPLVGPDIRHSAQEERFRAVGMTAKKRNLFVVFTFRQKGNDVLIRPISARYMHLKEVKSHEKEIPNS
jgi:uncharacterized DUF497 family protein